MPLILKVELSRDGFKCCAIFLKKKLFLPKYTQILIIISSKVTIFYSEDLTRKVDLRACGLFSWVKWAKKIHKSTRILERIFFYMNMNVRINKIFSSSFFTSCRKKYDEYTGAQMQWDSENAFFPTAQFSKNGIIV